MTFLAAKPLCCHDSLLFLVDGNLLVGAPQAPSPYQSLTGAVYAEEGLIAAYLEVVLDSVNEGALMVTLESIKLNAMGFGNLMQI